MRRLIILKMPKWTRENQRIGGRGKIKMGGEDQKLELNCKNLNRKKAMKKLSNFIYIFFMQQQIPPAFYLIFGLIAQSHNLLRQKKSKV